MNIKFGTDGWRGVIAEDFTFQNVRICAQGLAHYLKDCGGPSQGLVIGYDTRFGSERFAQAVAEVMAANSIPVYLCPSAAPTPVISFAIKQLGTAGAVIITASHNPGYYNGFKFRTDYAGAASDEVMVQVQSAVAQVSGGVIPVQRVALSAAIQGGIVRPHDPWPDYFRNIASLVNLDRIRRSPLRVVVDPMYGAGMGYFPRILAGSRVHVEEIHGERNPEFPGMRAPEPTSENLGELRRAVMATGAHVGLANDGDADRLALVDERGEFVDNFMVYPLLLYYVLSIRGARGTIVKTVATSSLVDRIAERFGVTVHTTGVGFKHIAPAMLQTQAIIGGEESGGYAFGDHLPERDGILAGLRILDLLSHTGRTLSGLVSEIRAEFGAYSYKRQDWTFEDGRQRQVQDTIKTVRPRQVAGQAVVRTWTMDGLRFDLADGSWLLLRLSGTEPLLRVYAESSAEEKTERLISEGAGLLGLV
jgi:phosphomannomutase